MTPEWEKDVFSDKEEALKFAAEHPGAEIEAKTGHPTQSRNGELYYPTPEDRPSWTVWWQKKPTK
mgnify:CR=1 FL=1